MNAKGALALLKSSGADFVEDDCPTQAAALSYYTIFSLPPLLMLLLLILGALVDPQDIRGQLEVQMGALMGPTATEQIRTILAQLHQPGSGNVLPTVLSIGGLVLGATGAFGQLQAALNRAWEVAPDPKQGGLKAFLVKRLFSFGMILSVAFLLLVSLVLSASLSAFGGALGGMLPEGVRHAAPGRQPRRLVRGDHGALRRDLQGAARRQGRLARRVGRRRRDGAAVRRRQVPHRVLPRPQQSGRRLSARPARWRCCSSGSTTPP